MTTANLVTVETEEARLKREKKEAEEEKKFSFVLHINDLLATQMKEVSA